MSDVRRLTALLLTVYASKSFRIDDCWLAPKICPCFFPVTVSTIATIETVYGESEPGPPPGPPPPDPEVEAGGAQGGMFHKSLPIR